MRVAYIFNTSGHTASYKLGKMILPQLEAGIHGAEVGAMFFFDDNTYLLRQGDPLGERLARVAREQNILLMLCDQCALERGLAELEGPPPVDAAGNLKSPLKTRPRNTVAGVQVGCFPDLYTALEKNPVDQVISL
ncbi:MAG TPA: SaoD/DsrE family protein [Chloroflexota bacterium]|nr:SaoD/DsrE family protein [Chloroflexota bacterium]